MNNTITSTAQQAPANAEVDPLFGALYGDNWFPSPAHVIRRAAILDAIADWTAGRLIEMGCGAGRLLADWDRLGHFGQAVEPDTRSRRLAQECVDTFELDFEVVAKPTLQDVDYIVSTEVLEHVEDPHSVVCEWTESLRSGGRFLATVPALKSKWGPSDEWAGHVQRFEHNEFRTLVESAGLTVTTCKVYGGPVGGLLRILGNRASARKMEARKHQPSRDDATFASGRDRTAENRVAPFLRSVPGRMLLHTAIAARDMPGGHGLLLVARK